MAQYTTTFTALQTEMEEFVEDNTAEFQSNFQAMVNRAEDRVLKDLNLSIWNKTGSVSTADGVQTINAPTGADVVRNVYDETSARFIERRTYDWIRHYGGSGAPLYFFEDQTGTPTKLYFSPTPDAVYTIQVRYLSRPSRLTTSNDTNWFTNNAGTALLYAGLLEAEHFLIDPTRIQEFQQEYASAMTTLRAEYRHLAQRDYEPLQPVPPPKMTR